MKKFLLFVFIFMVSCSQNTEEETVFGVVNGRYILGKDVMERLHLTKDNIRAMSEEDKIKIFNSLVDDFVAEHEANRVGVDLGELMSFFDKINRSKVEKDEVEFFIKNNPEKSKLSDENLKQEIRSDRLKRAKLKYKTELRARSTIRSFLDLSKDQHK